MEERYAPPPCGTSNGKQQLQTQNLPISLISELTKKTKLYFKTMDMLFGIEI